jgi:hypothetical protein
MPEIIIYASNYTGPVEYDDGGNPITEIPEETWVEVGRLLVPETGGTVPIIPATSSRFWRCDTIHGAELSVPKASP